MSIYIYAKHIVKQKFCAPSWLITETKVLSCTVSKTSKFSRLFTELLLIQFPTTFLHTSFWYVANSIFKSGVVLCNPSPKDALIKGEILTLISVELCNLPLQFTVNYNAIIPATFTTKIMLK